MVFPLTTRALQKQSPITFCHYLRLGLSYQVSSAAHLKLSSTLKPRQFPHKTYLTRERIMYKPWKPNTSICQLHSHKGGRVPKLWKYFKVSQVLIILLPCRQGAHNRSADSSTVVVSLPLYHLLSSVHCPDIRLSPWSFPAHISFLTSHGTFSSIFEWEGKCLLGSNDLDSNLVSPTAGSYLCDLDPVALSSLYLTSVIDEVGMLASQLIK